MPQFNAVGAPTPVYEQAVRRAREAEAKREQRAEAGAAARIKRAEELYATLDSDGLTPELAAEAAAGNLAQEKIDWYRFTATFGPELFAHYNPRLIGGSSSPTPQSPQKRKRVTIAEADAKVQLWFAAHAKVPPRNIRRDTVATETGLGAGTVSRTPAWTKFREANKPQKARMAREVQLTSGMQCTIPGNCPDPATLVELMEAQEAELAEDERPRQSRGAMRP